MSDRNPPFKFTTNVPVKADIRFIDVRPGKVWQGKKLPAQVSLKGTFDGEDTIAFLPGPAWKNIKALAENGVIDAQGHEIGLTAANDEELSESVSVPVAVAHVTATLTKLAGDKYEQMRYTTGNAVPSKRLPPPERVQPFDEPTDEERFAQFAEEVEELNAPVAQRHAEAPSVKASSVAGLLTKYAELFRAADLKLKEAYGAKCPPDVVQSAVATIWIESNKRGLV